MVDKVDRDAAFAHGQSVASSSVAFWDQIRKTSFFFGDESLKRFVVDTSRNAGDVLLQIKNTLGDYTYAPMTKMREVVGYMTQLNQLVMSTSKTVEDAILNSGMIFNNLPLKTELEIMNDQKRRFVATMSMLGEWLKFQRDRINKHSQQNTGPSAAESQFLAQQEAKKREEQLMQQQYEEWLRKQEQERIQREEMEKMKHMEQMMAKEREEKERNRILMEQKKKEEEFRLMESFKREQEEASKREEQRLQDAWKAKRESMKVEEDVKKSDFMARLQRSTSGTSQRPISGRVSPSTVDRQQEDLADELLKELGVTFVEPKLTGTRSLDSSPHLGNGSVGRNSRRPSSRGSLNVDELLGMIDNTNDNNPPPRSSSMIRNPSTNQTNPTPTTSTALPPPSSSQSLPEDPWDSLEKLADSISKRHSVVPSPTNSYSSYPSSPRQSDAEKPAKSTLDSLLESMEEQVYPPNSPSDGQYRHSFLVGSSSSSNNSAPPVVLKVSESSPPIPPSPSLSPSLSSGPFPGLSWRDQTISSSNSIEEIMSQLSVGEMRSSMRIPPAMISPLGVKRSESSTKDSGSNDDISKKISELEAKKKAAVANEDYPLASKLKEQIDELKAVADLRAMDSSSEKKKPLVNNNAKNEIDDLIRDLESL